MKVHIDQLVAFLKAYGPPKCYRNWTAIRIQEYLTHHDQQRTLLVVAEGDQVQAVAVGWQANESVLRRPQFINIPFTWEPTNPEGDSFYVAEVVCRGNQLGRVWQEYCDMFPNWTQLKLFMIRHAKLVELSDQTMFRWDSRYAH